MLEFWRKSPATDARPGFCVLEAAAGCRSKPYQAHGDDCAGAGTRALDALFDGMAQIFARDQFAGAPRNCDRSARADDADARGCGCGAGGPGDAADSVPTVATIRVPVLAIAGAEDSAVTPADMEAFRAAPGGCEFHVLPGAGHFAAYEQPRRLRHDGALAAAVCSLTIGAKPRQDAALIEFGTKSDCSFQEKPMRECRC